MRSFAARLVAWQKRHGRHDLPWQRTRDAYAVWLSEIMLQQTQVATAIPYYQRFLLRFPTVQALAEASLDDVLALWSGLGYYSRARNLHKAANMIVQVHGGHMPDDPQLVAALPGIGRSTAAAIGVFAYGGRHAILDGNVKRVLARHGGVRGYPGDARVQQKLWHHAEARLPKRDVVAYTQGLMDLGAGVCARNKPSCEVCPLRADCVAHAQGLTATLPGRKPRRALPQRHTVMLLLCCADHLLLEQRAPQGIWGGLWSLPELSGLLDAQRPQTARAINAAVRRVCREQFGTAVTSIKALPLLAHGFTHFKLDIQPLQVQAAARAVRGPQTRWFKRADALRLGLPAPVRKIIETNRN